MDRLTVIALVVAFAALVTAHVGLCLVWLFRRPRWRALAVLLVPPLAPWWGYREGYRAASVIWLVAFCLYLAALITASM